MAKRAAPEVNAGSMADIAFLLLIFFLVTTTIETDSGINRKLPPTDEVVDPPIIKERNIFTVVVNKNNQFLVEEEPMDIANIRQAAIEFLDNGGKFSFPEDKSIRDSEWLVAPPPEDVANRNVEITGPVDRKMIINALNSGADVFMADFEDSTTPTWNNIINGHINLIDANRKNLSYQNVDNGKSYELDINSKTSLFVRPRGLHLDEKNIMYDSNAVSASLFDFCLYIFHNANIRLKKS